MAKCQDPNCTCTCHDPTIVDVREALETLVKRARKNLKEGRKKDA